MYDYVDGKADWLAAGLASEGTALVEPSLGALARTDAPTARLEERVGEARERCRTTGWDRCWVVNEEHVLLGQLRAKELERAAPDARAEDAMLPGPSTFRPNVTAHEMLHLMDEHDLSAVPVTTSDGRLLGVVRREDLEAALADGAGGSEERSPGQSE